MLIQQSAELALLSRFSRAIQTTGQEPWIVTSAEPTRDPVFVVRGRFGDIATIQSIGEAPDTVVLSVRDQYALHEAVKTAQAAEAAGFTVTLKLDFIGGRELADRLEHFGLTVEPAAQEAQ